ncbi:MAG: substrate-binding domain-containing protein, partial [Lachnospiraceae bacterium]|nr:substrate-binding domain-containing protein [Lachnospiraceae bacterium]
LRTPLVQCSEFNEVNDVSYITIDNLEATRKMLRYILNTGRRQIALINSDPARYTYAKLRLQGYYETLEQAGIAVNPQHIVTVPDGNFSTAVPAISALLKTANLPDAIFCASDIMAAAALRACALEGFRVPQDIMVAGFDNIDISVMTTPNITTINQPRHDMGFMACTQLLSMIADPMKLPQRFILDTELIIRESTA